jgi:hypothetical protein
MFVVVVDAAKMGFGVSMNSSSSSGGGNGTATLFIIPFNGTILSTSAPMQIEMLRMSQASGVVYMSLAQANMGSFRIDLLNSSMKLSSMTTGANTVLSPAFMNTTYGAWGAEGVVYWFVQSLSSSLLNVVAVAADRSGGCLACPISTWSWDVLSLRVSQPVFANMSTVLSRGSASTAYVGVGLSVMSGISDLYSVLPSTDASDSYTLSVSSVRRTKSAQSSYSLSVRLTKMYSGSLALSSLSSAGVGVVPLTTSTVLLYIAHQVSSVDYDLTPIYRDMLLNYPSGGLVLQQSPVDVAGVFMLSVSGALPFGVSVKVVNLNGNWTVYLTLPDLSSVGVVALSTVYTGFS